MNTTKQTVRTTVSRLDEVADGVFRLGNRLFNWYLIREGKQFTLLDAGFPGYYQQLLESVLSLGGSIADIEAVIITHAHLDHVGLASRVAAESGAKIYMHPYEAKRAKRGGAQLPPPGLLTHFWRKGAFRILSTAVRGNVFFGPAIKRFDSLEDGAALSIPGSPRALFTPGHTVGSVSFLQERSGTLFTGDSLVTLDMRADKPCAPMPTPAGTHDNTMASIDSLGVYSDLGAITLLPGHGNPWEGQASEAVASAAAMGIPRW